MRKLALGRSLLYFLDEIEYTEAALAADSDAQSLALPFRDVISEWETLFKRERDARREVVRAEARVAIRNQHIDRSTIKFAALVRAVAPDFMDNVFKTAPNAFIRTNLRKQCETTKNVIVAEVDKLATDSPLKPFGSALESLATTTLTVLDARGAKKGAAQLVSNDVVEWKEGINNLRTFTHADLLKMAASLGYPKSWVDSFFRAATDDDDSESQNEETTPTPSTP